MFQIESSSISLKEEKAADNKFSFINQHYNIDCVEGSKKASDEIAKKIIEEQGLFQ